MIEKSRINERRTINGDKIDTIKIAVDGAITDAEIAALKAAHGEVLEHYITLYRPVIPQAEAERLKAAAEKIVCLDPAVMLKADLVAAVTALKATVEPGVKAPIADREGML